ncbi:larval cuticle protein LCP-30-like [Colias croceus]|uniref:larval cuticle protein LCP-30-like n=1 Tax=Colias crocea TaxID=72248 RepID=UPI001E27C834|nr:larval cuticle protein LCP-30-like [Colias croceus]
MKSFVAIIFTAVLSGTFAVNYDDGKYHPEYYQTGSKYVHTDDGQYHGKYNNNLKGINIQNRASQKPTNQLYNKFISLNQELVAPFAYRTSPTPVYATTQAPVVPVTRFVVPFEPYVKYAPSYANGKYLGAVNSRILNQQRDDFENGYRYNYQTENGISVDEVARFDSNGVPKVNGFYEYVGDNGLTYRVDYTADENGFHPSGRHLP